MKKKHDKLHLIIIDKSLNKLIVTINKSFNILKSYMEKNTLHLAKYFQIQAEENILKNNKNISVNADALFTICSDLIQKNLQQHKLINDFYERNNQWHQLISKKEINDSILAALIIHLENKNKALESEIIEIGEMASLGYFTLDEKGGYRPESTSENNQEVDLIELFTKNKID